MHLEERPRTKEKGIIICGYSDILPVRVIALFTAIVFNNNEQLRTIYPSTAMARITTTNRSDSDK